MIDLTRPPNTSAKRVPLKSPVRENRTPGSVRGRPGNRARLPRYVPQLGRWINRDPIGEEVFFQEYTRGLDAEELEQYREDALKMLYGFVDNNPVGDTDLYGLRTKPGQGAGGMTASFGRAGSKKLFNRYVDQIISDCESVEPRTFSGCKCCVGTIYMMKSRIPGFQLFTPGSSGGRVVDKSCEYLKKRDREHGTIGGPNPEKVKRIFLIYEDW